MRNLTELIFLDYIQIAIFMASAFFLVIDGYLGSLTVVAIGAALYAVYVEMRAMKKEYLSEIKRLEQIISFIPYPPTYTEEEMKIFNTAVQVINNNRQANGRFL